MTNNIAIIAARGGSKGLPRKNILDFCGKPLLAWTIEQALGCKSISSVWVTSDCQEILSIAEAFGANCVERPTELATDQSSSEAAWLHAINQIEKNEPQIDAVVALQATSPLREVSDLEQGLQAFYTQACDSLFSAAEIDDFLIWEKAGNQQLNALNYQPENRGRRQDRKPQYLENGSFYIVKPELLHQQNNRLGGKVGMSLMAFWKSFEIDGRDDFSLCEAIFKNFLLNLRASEKTHEVAV